MRIGCVLTGILLISFAGCELNQPLPKRQASGTVGGVGLEGAGVTPAPPQPAYQPPGADLFNQPAQTPPEADTTAASHAATSHAGPHATHTGPAGQPGATGQLGPAGQPNETGQPGNADQSSNTGQPGTTVQPAAPGVTGKGNYQPGLITTPVRVYFRVQERLIFEVQIPHAMQLFEAENGYKPRSHEEFMEKIIKANNLELPDLPPGHRYVYDPQQGELMVEHPG